MPDPAQTLEWDTKFWGIPIARAVERQLTPETAASLDDWCGRRNIDCLYFLARIDDPVTVRAAQAAGFGLTDVRLTFERAAQHSAATTHVSPEVRMSQPSDVPALQQIARGNHHDTRFYFDTRFPRPGCDELYANWIANACRGEADAVFVAEVGGEAAGYVSCNLESGSGTLGLVGIAPAARGRALGTSLVQAAIQWMAKRGVQQIQVATQARNLSGQRLYERCGFVTKSAELWYHKWYSNKELAWPAPHHRA